MLEAQASDDTDLLAFTDEQTEGSDDGALRPWRILIVDDDEDVHTATLFALDNVQILGRDLEFLHAYASADARTLLEREADIAVILLDVVMERDDAGLQLVRTIRGELGLHEPRIVLRTGQPGYAPEIEAIRDYDINDYKTKSELTRAKLFTTLTASIRSYDQIRSISNHRSGLDCVVQGCAALIQLRVLEDFSSAMIVQLAALLRVPAEGLVCVEDDAERVELTTPEGAAGYRVIAAQGQRAGQLGCPLARLGDRGKSSDGGDNAVRDAVLETYSSQVNQVAASHVTLFFSPPSGHNMVLYLDVPAPVDLALRPLLDVFASVIGVCLDNVALVSRLRTQAYVDPLVRLPNRVHFVDAVDAAIAGNPEGQLVLALVDIDHFAEINDALGHRYGDLLLKAVGHRLREHFSAGVMIARVAGDAFGVFGPNDEVDAQSLLALFGEALHLEGADQVVSVTLGLARIADVEGSGMDALKAASIALNRAKVDQRGDFSYFTREMGVEIRDRVRLLGELRTSFGRAGLHLNYQPQVRLEDGSPVGLEALLRWRDDAGRFVPPDRFVPLAEQSGLIVAIGDWVMRTACAKQKQLADAGFSGIRMAINVSVVQFRHARFLDMLDAALQFSGANPACIELEITESVAMLEADTMVGMFNAIKARGLQIAVDDFGTGFSSLSYLQRLAVDRLKIDRSFVMQMGAQDASLDAKTIAAMVIDLGSNLGLTVIAEGVEDESQAARLHRLGCHEAQGYYYGRPLDDAPLLDWLGRQRARFAQ